MINGRAPISKSTLSPFWFGAIGNRTGYPQQNKPGITFQKLRRFSETSIPRRLINYYRSQISRLRWQIVPCEGVEWTTHDQKRVREATSLLKRPNPDITWKTFIQLLIEDMCVPGVAPIEVKMLKTHERDAASNGGPDTPRYMLFPFDGASLQMYTDWDGSPLKPRYAQVLPNGKIVDFKNGELIPFTYTPRASTPFGLSPVETAVVEIEHLLNAQSYAGRVASNVTPKKALFIKNLTVEQRQELQQYWQSNVQGQAEIPFIGGEAVESIELGLVNDQSLFLQWQELLISVIASAFGIDAMKVNLLIGINRSTGDTLSESTDDGAIFPFADMIAENITTRILSLYGLEDKAEFRFIYATAASDHKAMATINQVELQADYVTIDEARERIGKGPLVRKGVNVGKMTVSEYREWIKSQYATPVGGGDGSNGFNDNPDSNQRGGNGAHGAAKPHDKPMNQRDDSAMRM